MTATNPSKYKIIRHRAYILIFSRYISLKDAVNDAPWFMRDKYGWPIEIISNRPLKSVLRIIFQNIRKVTG